MNSEEIAVGQDVGLHGHQPFLKLNGIEPEVQQDQYTAFLSEVNQYSITPRIFKGRETNDESHLTLKETYINPQGIRIHRFGINPFKHIELIIKYNKETTKSELSAAQSIIGNSTFDVNSFNQNQPKLTNTEKLLVETARKSKEQIGLMDIFVRDNNN